MKGIHENNFWDVNAELLILEEFNSLYKKDKSKNKEQSSKIMWAIYFAVNPESNFYNLPNKFDILAKDHLKDRKFNWETIQLQIDSYKSLVLTDAERALVNWNDTMVLRDNSIKNLYQKAIEQEDIDTLVKIDKMLASTAKMFDDYKKVRKDFEEEKTTKKGSKNYSLSDDDEI